MEKVCFITGRGLYVAISRVMRRKRTYNDHRCISQQASTRFARSIYLDSQIQNSQVWQAIAISFAAEPTVFRVPALRRICDHNWEGPSLHGSGSRPCLKLGDHLDVASRCATWSLASRLAWCCVHDRVTPTTKKAFRRRGSSLHHRPRRI